MRFRQRAGAAGLGWSITLVPLLLIGGLQWLFAEQIVAIQSGEAVGAPWLDSIAAAARASYLESHLIVATILLAHWLAVLLIGKGPVLRVRSANICLAIAGLLFIPAIALGAFYNLTNLFAWTCPLMGVSSPSPPQFRFGWSPCEVHSQSMLYFAAAYLPCVLVLASATLRLVKGWRWGAAQRP